MATPVAMTLVVAVVAWGTLATAAWAHIRAPRRFGDLLEIHLGDPRRAHLGAKIVTAVEVIITLGALVGYFASLRWLLASSAIAGLLLAIAYVGWVSRLVLGDSGLPCACSFSSAPPTWWSVARAAAICGFGAFMTAPSLAEIGAASAVGVFVAGTALGTAVYALPEAISWPSSALRLKRQVVASSTASAGAAKR